MRFKLYIEMALSILLELESLPNTSENQRLFKQIKIRCEDHQLNHRTLKTFLNEFKRLNGQLPPSLMAIEKQLNFKRAMKALFENPLRRYFESSLCITMLERPTNEMMDAVGVISGKLIKIIHSFDEANLKKVLEHLKPKRDRFQFGVPLKKFSKETLISLLETNHPKRLKTILYVHFMFAKDFLSQLKLHTQAPKTPQGRFAFYIYQFENGFYEDNLADFFVHLTPEKLTYLHDEFFKKNRMFTGFNGRLGRMGAEHLRETNQMGIMRTSQNHYTLPKSNSLSCWVSNARSIDPDTISPYVRFPLFSEALYVEGPSKSACMMLIQMEYLANFQTLDLKQAYLAAVMAYMVSGGNNCIHEILNPAEALLGLVPDYNTLDYEFASGPKAPNLSSFFDLFAQSSPEFQTIRERAWTHLLNYYDYTKDYFTKREAEEIKTSSSCSTKKCALPSISLKALGPVSFFPPLPVNTSSMRKDNTCHPRAGGDPSCKSLSKV